MQSLQPEDDELKDDNYMPKNLKMWHKPMNYMYLYNLNYSYRAKTEAIF